MDNRYGTYRQIRALRTWRPLGKMSWWRVIVGIALLVLGVYIYYTLNPSVGRLVKF